MKFEIAFIQRLSFKKLINIVNARHNVLLLYLFDRLLHHGLVPNLRQPDHLPGSQRLEVPLHLAEC